RPAVRSGPAAPAGRRGGPRAAPARVVRADRAVRLGPDRGRRRGGTAVPVPGRVVRPVRAPLAARGGGGCGPDGRTAAPGHGDTRRRRTGGRGCYRTGRG